MQPEESQYRDPQSRGHISTSQRFGPLPSNLQLTLLLCSVERLSAWCWWRCRTIVSRYLGLPVIGAILLLSHSFKFKHRECLVRVRTENTAWALNSSTNTAFCKNTGIQHFPGCPLRHSDVSPSGIVLNVFCSFYPDLPFRYLAQEESCTQGVN